MGSGDGWDGPCERFRRPPGSIGPLADYLRAAGVNLRPPGAGGKAPPAKPTNKVTPDPGSAQPVAEVSGDPFSAKPTNEVTPDSGAELAVSIVAATPPPQPGLSSSTSACEL